MKKTIYDLELHEALQINKWQVVRRVPGGWIYAFCDDETSLVVQTFVPYDDEFNFKN